MNSPTISLALCQFSPRWEDPAANHAVVEEMVREAKLEPGVLLVLPETFATGFSGAAEVAEDNGGPTDFFLRRLAAEHGIGVVAGLVRRGDDGASRNTAVLIDPTGLEIGAYAKRRPFVPGGEPWVPGELPGVFQWNGLPIALHICFDLRFPELFRDTLAPNPPVLHVVIASWPVARVHHWTHLLRARAIENQTVVVGVNRTGDDPFNTHNGQSAVFGPDGDNRLDCGSEAGIHRVRIQPAEIEAWRRRLPFLP